MRASHKKRIGRLIAALDEAEKKAVERRCDLAFEAAMYGDIRTAMEWRGIDPRSAWVLRRIEPRLANLPVSPELETADPAWLKAHRPPDDEDPLSGWLTSCGVSGSAYLDGSQP